VLTDFTALLMYLKLNNFLQIFKGTPLRFFGMTGLEGTPLRFFGMTGLELFFFIDFYTI
jgi:hypothetical protein